LLSARHFFLFLLVSVFLILFLALFTARFRFSILLSTSSLFLDRLFVLCVSFRFFVFTLFALIFARFKGRGGGRGGRRRSGGGGEGGGLRGGGGGGEV